ncbi:MAG: bifunctional precorrin-2 dehydrogenase/sirohydrochlorin ferrochelatase [Bradymonadaceae bacterium]
MSYPIQLDIEDRLVAVVGGGAVAERRIHRLLDHGAEIRLVAPAVTDHLAQLAATDSVDHRDRPYEESDLAGARLAFATTDDPSVNRRVANEANEREIPVNVADRSTESDFSVPAVARFEHLRLTIDTDGGSPALSAALRRHLESELSEGWDRAAGVLADLRDEAVETLDPRDRRTLFRELVDALPKGASGEHGDLRNWLVEAAVRTGIDPDALDWSSYLEDE